MKRQWAAVLVFASVVFALGLATAGPGPADRAVLFDLKSEPPGAEVWVDGSKQDTTPCLLRLSPGSRLVELRMEGRKTRCLAVLAAGGSRIVRDAYEMQPVSESRAAPAAPAAPLALGFTPRKWALLVGVNDYVDPNIPDLRGCCNDVKLLKMVLTQRYGFAEENIHLLLDREATKERMLSEITGWLGKEAGPGDLVVVAFSGHGRTVRMNPSEPIHDSIFACDGLKDAPTNDIRDDEFADAVAHITVGRIVVLFDTHHGKSVARGPQGEVLFTPSDTTREGFSEELKARLDAAKAPFVYLAACQPGQAADEKPFPHQGDRYYYFGALTYNLINAVMQMDPKDPSSTYQKLLENTAANLKRRGFKQEPFLAGDGAAALLAP